MNDILSNVIIINGIYDILCAISILKIVDIPVIKDLHLSMFTTMFTTMLKKRDNSEDLERFFAYWIFTYGIIRIYSGYFKKYGLAEISYYIEAVFIMNESFINGTMKIDRSIFVIVFSLFLGILCEFSRN